MPRGVRNPVDPTKPVTRRRGRPAASNQTPSLTSTSADPEANKARVWDLHEHASNINESAHVIYDRLYGLSERLVGTLPAADLEVTAALNADDPSLSGQLNKAGHVLLKVENLLTLLEQTGSPSSN